MPSPFDAEWASNLIHLRLNIPNCWWPGFSDTDVNSATLVEIDPGEIDKLLRSRRLRTPWTGWRRASGRTQDTRGQDGRGRDGPERSRKGRPRTPPTGRRRTTATGVCSPPSQAQRRRRARGHGTAARDRMLLLCRRARTTLTPSPASPLQTQNSIVFSASSLTPSAARDTGLRTKPYTPTRSRRTSNPRVERINSHPSLFLIRPMNARQQRGPPARGRGNLTSLLLQQKGVQGRSAAGPNRRKRRWRGRLDPDANPRRSRRSPSRYCVGKMARIPIARRKLPPPPRNRKTAWPKISTPNLCGFCARTRRTGSG